MPKVRLGTTMLRLGILLAVGSLVGCAGLEYAPKRGMLYYHKELPAAERAVEAARAAGKDRECPEQFRAAEQAKNDAYDIYWACRTAEAIAKANEATALANALCPRRVEVPPPAPPRLVPAPPPPPPPPAPSVAISASPSAIERGQCTTLMWSSVNVTSASIDQGLGSVTPDGSRQICPTATTNYTIAAAGPGGSKTASTTVSVTAPPPPPPAPAPAPAPRVVERLTIRVNFDLDKAVIRQADVAELQKAIDFVKRHPRHRISIEGHTDGLGGEQYNQGLSERRAIAVRDYLVKNGAADPGRMSTVGYGKSKPIAENATKEGRFQNRRVELVATPE